MRPEASVEVRELAPGLRLISLSGFLDSVAAQRLETGMELALPASGAAIIDMAEVEYCCSLGIRMLIAAARLMTRRGQRLAFAAAQPQVLYLLDMAHIPDIVPVLPSVADAERLLRG
jgi:anti-anti-sigma factor